MAAANAFARVVLEVVVVLHGKLIVNEREVVVLVHQSYPDAHRAGLTMVAVDAARDSALRRHLGELGVVALDFRRVKETEKCAQVVNVAHAWQHCEHSRAVERVLDALVARERAAEGGT